jgi:hypothetical protein
MISKPDYPCRVPDCWRSSEYFAIDNRGKYGHICRPHYNEMSRIDRDLYARTTATTASWKKP